MVRRREVFAIHVWLIQKLGKNRGPFLKWEQKQRAEKGRPLSGRETGHRNSDDPLWVVTLSGLIFGPYHGRRFSSALVPETVLSSAQGCDAGLYTFVF